MLDHTLYTVNNISIYLQPLMCNMSIWWVFAPVEESATLDQDQSLFRPSVCVTRALHSTPLHCRTRDMIFFYSIHSSSMWKIWHLHYPQRGRFCLRFRCIVLVADNGFKLLAKHSLGAACPRRLVHSLLSISTPPHMNTNQRTNHSSCRYWSFSQHQQNSLNVNKRSCIWPRFPRFHVVG